MATNRPEAQHPLPFPVAAPRRRWSVVIGQIVVAQVAAVLLVAAAGNGWPAVTGAALLAGVLLTAALARFRRRWLYEWLRLAATRATRPRTLPAGTGARDLLALVRPGIRLHDAELDGEPAAVLSDMDGLVSMIEVGDQGMLVEAGTPVPAPDALLPEPAPDQPRVSLQLLFTGAGGRTGTDPAATSYRQLTQGRVPAVRRTVLAVRVHRDQVAGEDALRRHLDSLVRKVRRRLRPAPTRLLGADAVVGVIEDLAPHDRGYAARVGWTAAHVGGLVQATYRLERWPVAAAAVVPRLLTLPTVATTVSLSATHPTRARGAPRVDLAVRLAAASTGGLAGTERSLRRLPAGQPVPVRRLDGEHLAGLAATLPLAAPAGGFDAATGFGDRVSLPGAGLMLGVNRHAAPILARLFRPEPTEVLIVGGPAVAHLVALRALGAGARVVVRTARPGGWEAFVRAAGGDVTLLPPAHVAAGPPGRVFRPLLQVVDVGAAPADGGVPAGAWCADLVVRDEVTAADVDGLVRADLVVAQPLAESEAALLGTARGLGEATAWLSRISPEMVAVISRGTVCWCLLSPTPVERRLVGPPSRHPHSSTRAPG